MRLFVIITLIWGVTIAYSYADKTQSDKVFEQKIYLNQETIELIDTVCTDVLKVSFKSFLDIVYAYQLTDSLVEAKLDKSDNSCFVKTNSIYALYDCERNLKRIEEIREDLTIADFKFTLKEAEYTEGNFEKFWIKLGYFETQEDREMTIDELRKSIFYNNIYKEKVILSEELTVLFYKVCLGKKQDLKMVLGSIFRISNFAGSGSSYLDISDIFFNVRDNYIEIRGSRSYILSIKNLMQKIENAKGLKAEDFYFEPQGGFAPDLKELEKENKLFQKVGFQKSWD